MCCGLSNAREVSSGAGRLYTSYSTMTQTKAHSCFNLLTESQKFHVKQRLFHAKEISR